MNKRTVLADDDLGSLTKTWNFIQRRLQAPKEHPGKLDLSKVKKELQRIIWETGRANAWSRNPVTGYLKRFGTCEEHVHVLRHRVPSGPLLGPGDIVPYGKHNKDINSEKWFGAMLLLESPSLGTLESDIVCDYVVTTPEELACRPEKTTPGQPHMAAVGVSTVFDVASNLGLERLSPAEAPQALLKALQDISINGWEDLRAAMDSVEVDQRKLVFFMNVNHDDEDGPNWRYQLMCRESDSWMVGMTQLLLFKKRKL